MDLGLLLLRLGAALLLFAGHGWPKIANFAERAARFADPLGLGPQLSFGLVVFAEVGCAIAIALGLLTRWAVVPLLIFFAVAAFVQHAADPWARKELALIFAVPFATLLFTGPGHLSLDAWMERRRTRGAMEMRRR
jgi:putative oxidoreductase